MSDLLDLHGKQVHAFATQVANLGFAKMADELLAMLDSGAWLEFKDGLGVYRFLPGEFDYFLSQQGVSREDVINGVRDLDVKARLDEHMNERRTGEDGYRRRVESVRRSNPSRPGRTIAPFGSTDGPKRPALGDRVRRVAAKGERRRDTHRWQVQWTDRAVLPEAIVAKLLDDPGLAHEVWKRLHSGVVNAYQKKRRSGGKNLASGDREQRE